MHADIAAHGYFEMHESLSDITRADMFQREGEKTPAFVRFSTVAGNKGSADLARDVRGFAVKLYTKEGNWDIVGNNIPVFFIQDAIKFPDLIHAAKQEPDRGFPQAQTAHDNFWDFISLTPEAMHMVMWIMSDRTIPRSFRFMEGFGVHTFRLVNAKGKSTFVKFHWKPKLGLQSVAWNEAVKINGADPDFHRRDLWNAIQTGDFPEWELGLQLFDDKFADKFRIRRARRDQADPRRAGAGAQRRPPGAGPRASTISSPKPSRSPSAPTTSCRASISPTTLCCRGAIFPTSTPRSSGWAVPISPIIPINAPKCPFHTFQQDGHMAMVNPKGRANYEPNSWGGAEGGPRETPERGFPALPPRSDGPKLRVRSETFADHYSQARQFYISQTPVEQDPYRRCAGIRVEQSRNAGDTRPDGLASAQHRWRSGERAWPTACGSRHAGRAKPARPIINLPASDALSIVQNGPASFAGRKVGALVTDGVDSGVLGALKKAVKAAGATLEIIAPQIGGVTASDGSTIIAQQKVNGGPSVLYDAVAVLTSRKARPCCSARRPRKTLPATLLRTPSSSLTAVQLFRFCRRPDYRRTAAALSSRNPPTLRPLSKPVSGSAFGTASAGPRGLSRP